MKTGELSTGTPTLSNCCKAEESWKDCPIHDEGCFATYCESCNQITYKDCQQQPNHKKFHEHNWECTDTPAVFKCIKKFHGKKCTAIRVYDRNTETYTVSYSYKRAGAQV